MYKICKHIAVAWQMGDNWRHTVLGASLGKASIIHFAVIKKICLDQSMLIMRYFWKKLQKNTGLGGASTHFVIIYNTFLREI